MDQYVCEWVVFTYQQLLGARSSQRIKRGQMLPFECWIFRCELKTSYQRRPFRIAEDGPEERLNWFGVVTLVLMRMLDCDISVAELIL